MNWKPALRKGQRYLIVLGLKTDDGNHLSFLTTVVKVHDGIVTTRDDTGGVSHFDETEIKLAIEQSLEAEPPSLSVADLDKN